MPESGHVCKPEVKVLKRKANPAVGITVLMLSPNLHEVASMCWEIWGRLAGAD